MSTIYTRFNQELYLKYFLRRPTCYPFLLQLALRKFRGRTAEPSANDRFDTPERKNILRLVQKITAVQIVPEDLLTLPQRTLPRSPQAHPDAGLTIPLATTEVELDVRILETEFDDLEDTFAANRFIWLYDILLNHPQPDALETAFGVIKFWAERYSIPDAHPRYESYSICERTIAWLFFLIFTRDQLRLSAQDANLLAHSLELQLDHLVHHLEYHGPRTNNHILNNARALYMVGRLLKLDSITVLGREIFRVEKENIICEGVYQEGSSHYHLLLTKNLLEMHLVASLTGDNEFAEKLKAQLGAMLKTCVLVQSKYGKSLPLFGDISPDLPPSWFCGYPFGRERSRPSQWFRLFNYDAGLSRGELEIPVQSNGRSGLTSWRYLHAGPFEAWINLREGGVPCHGHNDNGAVVLFYKGEPLVFDLGVHTYCETEISTRQVSAEGHNLPIVAGYEADISRYSPLSAFSLYSTFKLLYSDSANIEYAITYANGNIRLIRSLNLTEKSCTIVDNVETDQPFDNYSVNLHCNERLEQTGPCEFHLDELALGISGPKESKAAIVSTYKRSERYGDVQPCNTITCRCQIAETDSVTFCIKKREDE